MSREGVVIPPQVAPDVIIFIKQSRIKRIVRTSLVQQNHGNIVFIGQSMQYLAMSWNKNFDMENAMQVFWQKDIKRFLSLTSSMQ